MDLYGFGVLLMGSALLSVAMFGVGFVSGFTLGKTEPFVDIHLSNSTISICELSTGYYRNDSVENATRCPEVRT